ncbi:MAG: phosphotransferase [Anaerolineales bacterium]|nr:MAG: phosphotransferase [Anaerolineales bacterium]
MLTKPDIADELIISRLQDEYNLHVSTLIFLPLGADMGTAVYRVVADDGTAYFLKLRKGFDPISVTIPLFLKSQGIKEIFAPIETRSKVGWADFGEYKMILYPFIEGKNGFEMELSDSHKRTFGAALKGIHSLQLPPELKEQLPQETWSPKFREQVREFQRQVEKTTFSDVYAAKLANFIKSRRIDINHLIKWTEELASKLQSQSYEFVLCHTDVHGGNILITIDNQFYIVDWDAPLLAPKERDLMFIGGGIDDIWKSKRDESVFYEGYGKTDIDFPMMAYYRYERVIEDLAAYAEQLLSTDKGGADREEAYRRFRGNFEAGSTIEIAEKTDHLSS